MMNCILNESDDLSYKNKSLREFTTNVKKFAADHTWLSIFGEKFIAFFAISQSTYNCLHSKARKIFGLRNKYFMLNDYVYHISMTGNCFHVPYLLWTAPFALYGADVLFMLLGLAVCDQSILPIQKIEIGTANNLIDIVCVLCCVIL